MNAWLSLFMAPALLGAIATQAAVVINTLQEDLADPKATSRSEITLEKDKLRLDLHGEHEMTLIYRKDKDVFWMIRPGEKAYTEMTSKDLEQMAQTLEAARAKLQEQLKNLPEEQRAMMEKMMGGMMAPPAEPKITFKKALGTGKVGGFACQNWESYLDGVKSADHCVADFKSADITAADFEIFKDMTRFVGKLAPSYKGVLDQSIDLERLGGIPVQTTVIEDGKADTRITLETIRRVKADAGRFELPVGLKKTGLPMGKMGKP